MCHIVIEFKNCLSGERPGVGHCGSLGTSVARTKTEALTERIEAILASQKADRLLFGRRCGCLNVDGQTVAGMSPLSSQADKAASVANIKQQNQERKPD